MGLRIVVMASAFLLATTHAQAQAPYPNKPVHIIIPYSPGSPTDTYTRKIANVAQVKLGVPIVIENKAGASGVLGSTQVARSAPDGYTLLASPSEPFIASTAMIKSVPYDSMKDFRFITKMFISTPALVVHTKFNIRRLSELVEKAKTETVPYGSFGPGSFHQLSLEELSKQAGIRLQEVPYRAPVQAAQAVLAGEVALGYIPPTQAMEQMKLGKVNILAVIGTRRHDLMPDVPSFAEAGFNAPILRTAFWTGLIGPAGIPDSVVAKIHDAFRDALQDPEIQSFFAQTGNGLVGNAPADFEKEIREEYEQVIPLIKAMNITPQ